MSTFHGARGSCAFVLAILTLLRPVRAADSEGSWGTLIDGTTPAYLVEGVAVDYSSIIDALKIEHLRLTITIQSLEKLQAELNAWAQASAGRPLDAAALEAHAQTLERNLHAPVRAMVRQAESSDNAALGEAYSHVAAAIKNQLVIVENAARENKKTGAAWTDADIRARSAAIDPELQALRTRQATAGGDKEPVYVKQIGQEMIRVRKQYTDWGFRVPRHQIVTLMPVSYGGECLFGQWLAKAANVTVEGQATLKGHLHAGVLTDSKTLVPLAQLRHTLAHEYFHRCQMQYYGLLGGGGWFREGTAGLLELLMYPDDIKQHANHNSFKMELRTTPLDNHSDDAAAFFFFLGTKYGNAPTDITRSLWEEFLNKSNFAVSTAIENVMSSRKQTMRDLFHEFAEAFYTTDPRNDPHGWFYAAVRTDHRLESGQPYKAIVEDTLKNAKEDTAATLNLKPLTATYTLYDRGAPTDLEVSVDDAFGVLVRFYAVTPAGTTYVASASSKGTVAAKLPIGGGNRIGVLVSCVAERTTGGMFDRGDFSSGVKLTFKDTKPDDNKPPVTGAFQPGDAEAIDPRMKREGDSSQEQILLGDSLSGNCWTHGSLYSTNVIVQINRKPDAAAAVDQLKRETKTQQEDMEKFVRSGETYNWKTADKSSFAAGESIRHQVRNNPADANDPTEEVIESYTLYRDVFVIRVRLTQKMQPEPGPDGQMKTVPLADFTPQRKALLAKAQALTDKRFPK